MHCLTHYSPLLTLPAPAPALSVLSHNHLVCRMEGDLKTAAEELVKVRRERLRALYAADRASWQGRLAGMGLAMETS